MRAQPSRTPSAFTLIELLVVIAIVAILAAILFPVFAQAKQKGKQTQCLSNTKQIAVAFRLYSDDYDGVLPGSGCSSRVGWVDGRRKGGIETGEIFPYVKSAGAYLCPCDPNLDGNRYSYGMSQCMDRRSEYTLSYPASTVLLLEENEDTAGGNTGLNDGCFFPYYQQDKPAVRHNKGGHFIYGDTHTKWHPAVDFRFQRTGPDRGIGRLWHRYDPTRPEEDGLRLPWRESYCHD